MRFHGMLSIVSDPHSRTGGHGHDHDGGHDHRHEHDDQPGLGLPGWIRYLLHPHSHEPADQVDAVMEASAAGMRTLWISLAVLAVAVLIQGLSWRCPGQSRCSATPYATRLMR